jgi:hypothetical protein
MPLGANAELNKATLVNAKDIDYVIDLYMGGRAGDKVTVVPDTGSTWLSIESSTCSTCLGTKYDYTGDSTFATVDATTIDKNYGAVKTKGFRASDTICMKASDATACTAAAFNIFIITYQSGIPSNIDGIWGMASNFKTTANSGSLLLDGLKANSKISKKIFAFGLNLKANTSFLDLGMNTIDNTRMRSAANLKYIPAMTDYWWAANMNGIKFGAGQNLTNAYKFATVTPAFVDSGSTCTYIPKVYYNAILTEILKKATSHSYNSTWGTLVPCSDKANLDPI